MDLVAYRHKIKKSKLFTLSENEKRKISIIEELALAKKDSWRLESIDEIFDYVCSDLLFHGLAAVGMSDIYICTTPTDKNKLEHR